MITPPCNCAELRLTDEDGTRALPCPSYPEGRHDCAEVRRRNAQIQTAETFTHERLRDQGIGADSIKYGTKFTAIFARKMEELCRA